MASLITTPFILWFSLPKSTEAIIDFFRDSSLYVDGLGYVCKYAMFDDVNAKNTTKPNGIASKSSDHVDGGDIMDSDNERAMNKMMQSFLYFADDYENDEQALGKYQLPQDNVRINPQNEFYDNHNYSWKKQFKPGQKPVQLRANKAYKHPEHHTDTAAKRKASASNGPMESFIQMRSSSSSRFNRYSENDSRVEPLRREGVLKLVKEYYEQSNV